MTRIAFPIALALALTGCAHGRRDDVAARASVTMEAEPAWRTAIMPGDVARIEGIGSGWTSMWAEAGRRWGRSLRAEGDLLKADAALAHPALPPGSYRCRSVAVSRAAVHKSPSFFCYVGDEEGDRVSFTKQTGPSATGGWLYPDGQRYVFLGTTQRRGRDPARAYGEEQGRNLVGVVERVGPFRWRLVLPGSGFKVYELTPVPVEQQGATG